MQTRRPYMPPAVVALRLTETPQVHHLFLAASQTNNAELQRASGELVHMADSVNGRLAGLLMPRDDPPWRPLSDGTGTLLNPMQALRCVMNIRARCALGFLRERPPDEAMAIRVIQNLSSHAHEVLGGLDT